jgi:hypothetical protein
VTRHPAVADAPLDQLLTVGIYIAQEAMHHEGGRMIRIETSVRGRRVLFAVMGRIESNDLPELKRLIESHRRSAILDLKGVTLVDRDVVTFLANFETTNGRITNCPTYVREWIRRDQQDSEK